MSVPRGIHESSTSIYKCVEDLYHSLRRMPTVDEIAEATGFTPQKVSDVLGALTPVYSFDTPPFDDTEVDLYDTIPDPQDGITELIDDQWRHAILTEALDKLSEEEATVIRLTFGIGRDAPMTQSDISQLMGMSPGRARHLLRTGIIKMQSVVRASLIAPAECVA